MQRIKLSKVWCDDICFVDPFVRVNFSSEFTCDNDLWEIKDIAHLTFLFKMWKAKSLLDIWRSESWSRFNKTKSFDDSLGIWKIRRIRLFQTLIRLWLILGMFTFLFFIGRSLLNCWLRHWLLFELPLCILIGWLW